MEVFYASECEACNEVHHEPHNICSHCQNDYEQCQRCESFPLEHGTFMVLGSDGVEAEICDDCTRLGDTASNEYDQGRI
jgi:hypothetical protein